MGKKLFSLLLCFFLSVGAALAQDIQVSGTIKESNGDPVSGAAVVLKSNTTVYTMTDALGNYKLTVPKDGILSITCMGFQSTEIPVNGRSVIDVTLKLDSEMLDETIVVAFGTATKESFTGSAAVVGSEKLAQSQVSSVTNALAGAVAGVQLTSSNGAPGSSSTIRIRGFSSINAGKDPLIILDGAPYGGAIADINPNDIESLTVLKDAASNALYGARGANGVIMITTKKAKAGEANVTFNAKIGFNSKALRQYRVIKDPALYYETHYNSLFNYYVNSGASAMEAWKTANSNIGGEMGNGGLGYIVYTVPENQAFIGTNGKLNPNATLGVVEGDYYFEPDDWADYAYRHGLRQEYDLSVAGSNERSTFYSSISYLNEEGITKASDLERLTARLRADYKVKDWMKVGGNVSYTHYRSNSLGNNGSSASTGNIWAFTSQIAPIYPLWIRNADKSIKVDGNGIKMMDYGNGIYTGHSRPFLSDANAIQDSELNTRLGEGNASTGNGFIDLTFIDGLTLTVNGTYNLTERRYTNVYNPYYGQFDSTGGTVEKEHDRWFDYNLQQILNYKHTFSMVHNMAITLGHEYTKEKLYVLGASKSKMFSQDNKELSGAAVDGQASYSYVTTYNNEGFFLRAQYDYDNKIFASASYRRDASSRFDPDYRWGNFWSAGIAWVMSKEPWFKASWVDELKLKTSIGSQGNDNIGNYRYVDLFNITNSSGDVATSFNSKGTRDITWETNTNFNIGAEFSFLNRISGSLEYFYRKTTDMLFSFSVAPSLGYPNYYDNVGDLYNQGVELDLNINIINSKNIRWDFNVNATTLKNRITMLDPDKKISSLYTKDGKEYKGYNSGNFFVTEDQAIYTWRLKDFAGVDQNTGESLWYKNTFDEDGNWTGRETTSDYSEADYYVTKKTSVPDIYGGFGTSIQAFGFDFSINFSYQLGGYQYDGTYADFMSCPTASNTGYNFHADVLKAWTADNPSNTIPRWQFNDIYSAGASTRFLTKSSYLNLENVNLGYTIPSKLTKKIQIQSLRIFLAGQNIWYWSKRRGFDPRQSYSGGTNATYYSPMRTVSAGVTIKF